FHKYNIVTITSRNISNLEAGNADTPTLIHLHEFPTSSHMFRDLMPGLDDRYHLVAPDLPGFGFSDAPARAEFKYTFDNLARVIEVFAGKIGLQRYALYVFDYGAPVGFRLALAHPERVTAIISQNGNAYEEGLSQGWNPIQRYWRERTRRIARRFGTFSSRRLQSGNTPMGSGMSHWWRRSPTRWTPRCWPGPAMTRFSSTCSSTMRTMWRSIRSSRPISAPNVRRCWQFGGRTIPSSCRPAPRRSSGIS